MDMNVLKSFGYSRRYYLRHPLRFLRECGQNIRNAWMRITRGWCYMDTWNIDIWFLEVMPQMLRHLAKNGCGYPGVEPFDTPEKWNDWLNAMADTFESLQESNWNSHNEYEKLYNASVEQSLNPNSNVQLTMSREELAKLYYTRMRELAEEGQVLLEDTMTELGKHLHSLWD